MGKQKKNGNKTPLERIVFVTVLIQLFEAVIDFIKTLLE